jgi:WD40-like Beta Propeller Repeat
MTKISNIYLLILACVFVSNNNTNAQNTNKFTAKTYFKYKDYNRSLAEYLKLYKNNKEDINLNTKIGICYLQIDDDKTKAIPFLEYVYKKGGYNNDLLLNLGLANMYAYKFDEAINYFNEYKKKTKVKDQDVANHYIKNCESAKEFIKKPVNVTFENLGKNINSKFPDFNPFVTKDQKTLYFTSGRDTDQRTLKSSEGFYTSDIYFSKKIDQQWTKAKSVGQLINTPEDEQCVFLSPDGKNMIIAVDNEFALNDLFDAKIEKEGTISNTKPYSMPINTKRIELEGCITEDENILIISSNRAGGTGEMDLYMFKKLPNNEWGLPINLGTNINTPYNEAFPLYDEKSNTLYFSSEGHDNMGGYDIFKSQFNEETQTFEKAVNMGYPINTPEDNMQFTCAENKRDGYISAYRKEGFGDLDIYKLIFKDIEVNVAVLKGIITVNDSINKNIEAVVSIFNTETNNKVEAKRASKKNGKYLFALEPGKYLLTVSSPNYEDYSKEIIIYDKSDMEYNFEIERNINLKKYQNIAANDTVAASQPINASKTEKIVFKIIDEVKDSGVVNEKTPQNLVYRIQIGAFKNPVPKKIFKGVIVDYTETFPGGTKYFNGEFSDYTSASKAKDNTKSIGLTDVFIVAYLNKKHIAIEEARILESKK